MQQHHQFLRIYYLLAVFLTLQPQHIQSIRCKCNTNRGPAPCIGDFCDIHSRDGKRAACGALRRARQTIFACVLIRRSTNDTYCHVVGSTTACWCRQMDFCNADLEAELFDVEETADDSDADSNEQSSQISGPEQEESIIEATLQQLPAQLHNKTLSVTQPLSTIATTVASAASSITVASRISTSTKRSTKSKINPAIRMDFAERMKITPERKEQSPGVVAEMIYDNYEYELDENDDGYQWQAIAIPDSAVASPATSIPPTHAKPSTNSQKVENSKSRTIEVVITKLSPTAPVTTTTVHKTTSIESVPEKAHNTTITSITLIQDDSMKESASGQFPVPNAHSVLLSNEKSPNSEVSVQDSRPKLISNSLLSPAISLATSTMVSTSTATDQTIKENITTRYSAKAQEILLQQQQIPEKPSNYARRKLNSTSPTFIYTHSVPKTVLDQWKWEERQQQQLPSDLDRSDDINDNSDSSNTASRLSSAFFTSSFSFLFLLLLFSSHHY